ncbi:MAG: hypothetical protein HC795_17615 [Coleofasciculaceae cyanobacterium RL_1_1]|nr:hypothetical protein [Coleofasciculaceae cyanobacterium RL_1_1]
MPNALLAPREICDILKPYHSEATHRDVFPTMYSTLVSDALVDRVLSQYDIPAVTRCHFWHRGLSDVYWSIRWGRTTSCGWRIATGAAWRM